MKSLPPPFYGYVSNKKGCEFNPSLSHSYSHALPCSGQHASAKTYLSINNTILFDLIHSHCKCISLSQRRHKTVSKIKITYNEKICLMNATVIFVLSSNFLYRIFFCRQKRLLTWYLNSQSFILKRNCTVHTCTICTYILHAVLFIKFLKFAGTKIALTYCTMY